MTLARDGGGISAAFDSAVIDVLCVSAYDCSLWAIEVEELKLSWSEFGCGNAEGD